MRAAAVADHDEAYRPAGFPRRRDQTAAAEALVIRMGGDDHQTAATRERIEAGHGQRIGRGEERVGPHHRTGVGRGSHVRLGRWAARGTDLFSNISVDIGPAG